MNKLDQFQKTHLYLKKFEVMQNWMGNDLKNSTIYGKANLLVAMGIFNYIEILGAFYRYHGAESRFNFAINSLMPSSYGNVCKRLNKITTDGAYDTLRCGMTHEYLIKTKKMKNPDKKLKFKIIGSDTELDYDSAISNLACGLKLESKKNIYYLYVINARFIYDLNSAFDRYKTCVNNDIKGYRKYFLKRSEEVGLELLN